MTSQPAFTYPIAHSTFIPVSYQSVTTSGQIRKRKRTKSLGTEPGQDDGDDNGDGDNADQASDREEARDVAQDENRNASQRQQSSTSSGGGLRSLASQAQTATAAPWAPVNALTVASADDKSNDENNTSDDQSEEKSKPGRGNIEHRIRNAGYGADITDALPPIQPSSLQAKHMSHLNTILHLCLLRRDWKRAKRAFKLLLLSDSQTDVRNLRLKGIWKLGVEILSWEEEEITAPDNREDSSPKRDYTKAVEYMNRLVIMYPHYKHYVIGKGVNATTILPILMHFEIFALHEKLSTALTSGEATVVIEVIAGITAVTDRLKSLQETPPWVDMGELWKLRGQLYTWAADLSLRLLNDEGTHIKYKILGHKLALKMKERRISGWKEFAFEYDGEIIDEDDDNDIADRSF
ncbi:hypothetical protein TWF694_004145 [Orbilia ellipsospora]|uniref:Uncharacterized protein n=1 Tax=Orbilia ellipsospora TaxID=2528407 RepID=A0AAV9WX62_9PEZI